MKLSTARFGEIEIDDNKIISFPQGIPGLEQIKKYALIHHDKTHPINWLQAIDEPLISLPVVEPFYVMPDYAFNISDSDVTELGLNRTGDLHVVNVVTIPEKIDGMTVNLAAPILINIRMNLGKQIIIDRKNYQIKYPAFEPICKQFREVRAHAGAVEKS